MSYFKTYFFISGLQIRWKFVPYIKDIVLNFCLYYQNIPVC